METEKRRDRNQHTDRQTERETDGQRQTDRNIRTDRHTDRQAEIESGSYLVMSWILASSQQHRGTSERVLGLSLIHI